MRLFITSDDSSSLNQLYGASKQDICLPRRQEHLFPNDGRQKYFDRQNKKIKKTQPQTSPFKKKKPKNVKENVCKSLIPNVDATRKWILFGAHLSAEDG